jgi:hypothetical protein
VITVLCTLWPGGDFGPEDVTALRLGVEEHLREPHRFVCITDAPVDCEAIPFATDWWTHDGWWGKLEVFRPDIPGDHRLYLDLDTLPVGDLSLLARWRGNFAAMRDVYVPDRLQASVMAFSKWGVAHYMWREFREDGERIRSEWRGDQWWFTDRVLDPVRLQDEVPGIYSLKVHAMEAPPKDASLVVAHGKPRLSDPAAGWAHELWRSRCSA